MDLSRIQSLLPEFKRTFLDTPKGRKHMAWFPSGRETGRRNVEEAVRRADAGEDVTDFVLAKLLPHLDSQHNRARGAWCCIAPAVTRDIQQWFEGVGWAKRDDWPHVAPLVLRFVRAVSAEPPLLEAECEAFANSRYSKGLQSGFLSPILNAVRPEAFSMVNSKTKKSLKTLAGLNCRTRLIHYPASNALVLSIVDELGPEIPSADVGAAR